MKILRLVAIVAASFVHFGASLSAAAADTYRLCEEQMLSALGMKPSAETANLYRAIGGSGR